MNGSFMDEKNMKILLLYLEQGRLLTVIFNQSSELIALSKRVQRALSA